MTPELENIIGDVTKSLGVSAHAKGTIMEVDLNWEQLDLVFQAVYQSLSVRFRSIMGTMSQEQWVSVCRALTVKRISFVRETVYGHRDFDYPRVLISKAYRMHGVLHTLFSQIGLFKSEDLGYRFIPQMPPKTWATIDGESFALHADVIEALRARGVVTSEGFPSDAHGSMAYLLYVRDHPSEDQMVIAEAPSKEATPNDGMLASVVFQTRTVLALGSGYDFNPVAQPQYVLRRLIGAYVGGKDAYED